jgi:hypothetical protein
VLKAAREASLLAVLVVSLTGCGSGGARVVPVAGTVTLGEQPVASGTVTLVPLAAGDTAAPVGTIENGRYTLATGAQEGAPLGKYKVVVNASAPTNPDDPYSLPKSLVPQKYTDPAKTDLVIEIVAAPASGAYDLKLRP